MAIKISGTTVVDDSRNLTNITGIDSTTLSTLSTDFVTPTYTGDVDITGELIVDSYNQSFVTLSGTSPSINCEAGNVFSITLTGNTTFTFSNPPATGTAYGFTLKIIQDSTIRTVTWPTSVDWPGGVTPTISNVSGRVDVFVFFTHNGGTTWYGFTAGQGVR